MDSLSLLEGSDLFRVLDPDARTRVAGAAEPRSLRRGDMVFGEDDPAEALYIVKSGRVAIVKTATDGRESMVALMEAGDLFGEMSLFDRKGRSAGARALEPSEILSVGYPPIRAVLEERPQLLWGVVELLANRLRTTDEALADSVFLDVTGRTAKRLLELAGEEDQFILPVTQEELAGLVGASRERVNKAIAAFVRLGWLEQSDRQYRITDRAKLAQRAG